MEPITSSNAIIPSADQRVEDLKINENKMKEKLIELIVANMKHSLEAIKGIEKKIVEMPASVQDPKAFA